MQNIAICDANERYAVTIDKKTHALVGITVPHHEVHEGEMFCISQTTALAIDYLFTVPANYEAHLVFEATADVVNAAGTNAVSLFPLVTATAVTAFTQIFNRKTAGGLTPQTVVTTAPTGVSTTDATTRAFFGLLMGIGVPVGSLDRDRGEFILTPGKHLLRVTRGTGNINLQIMWYEEPLTTL
jgi:hypothetical protein